MSQLDNHIFILTCEAENGFGIAVIGCPPGEDPYRRMLKWFDEHGEWDAASRVRKDYQVNDVHEFGTDIDGVITMAEYFDGASSYGRKEPTRYDYFKDGLSS